MSPPMTHDPTKPSEIHSVTRPMFPRVVGMEQQGQEREQDTMNGEDGFHEGDGYQGQEREQDTMNGRTGGEELEEREERAAGVKGDEGEKGEEGEEGEEEGEAGRKGRKVGGRRRRLLFGGRHRRRRLLFGSIMKGGPLQILAHDVDSTKCWNDA